MNPLLQALAFELFHDDEGVSAVVVNFVDDADIWMVELRGRTRFASKSIERPLIFQQMIGNKFKGNMAAKAEVLRFINNSHSAASELRQHAVMGNRLTDDLHRRIARALRP